MSSTVLHPPLAEATLVPLSSSPLDHTDLLFQTSLLSVIALFHLPTSEALPGIHRLVKQAKDRSGHLHPHLQIQSPPVSFPAAAFLHSLLPVSGD